MSDLQPEPFVVVTEDGTEVLAGGATVEAQIDLLVDAIEDVTIVSDRAEMVDAALLELETAVGAFDALPTPTLAETYDQVKLIGEQAVDLLRVLLEASTAQIDATPIPVVPVPIVPLWSTDWTVLPDGGPGSSYSTGGQEGITPYVVVASGVLAHDPVDQTAWITRIDPGTVATGADQFIKAYGVDLVESLELGICQANVLSDSDIYETKHQGIRILWAYGAGYYNLAVGDVNIGVYGDGSIPSGTHDIELRRVADVYSVLIDGVLYDSYTDPSPPAHDDTLVYQRVWFQGNSVATIDRLDGGDYP